MTLKGTLFLAVLIFSCFSLILFLQHEASVLNKGDSFSAEAKRFLIRAVGPIRTKLAETVELFEDPLDFDAPNPEEFGLTDVTSGVEIEKEKEDNSSLYELFDENEQKENVLNTAKYSGGIERAITGKNNLRASTERQGKTDIPDSGTAQEKETSKVHIIMVELNSTTVGNSSFLVNNETGSEKEKAALIEMEEINELEQLTIEEMDASTTEKRGVLICNGKRVESEVIYWKVVPGDIEFESPITPHHGQHDDKYLSFEYDNGGWNNVRMSMECLIVAAHAMGRTLVVPPRQHLYLLGQAHPDEKTGEKKDEFGFEDFFNVDLLRAHKGFHVLSMEEFLAKEGVTGGLKGKVPPRNSTKIWGPELWWYLEKVAEVLPQWQGRFLAMPDRPGDFNLSEHHHPKMRERLARFGGERHPVYYDEKLQQAHHIHFYGREGARILQHHYAFVFFASPNMQSYYRRFVRDFIRYQDEIQCAGDEVVRAVRADALALNTSGGGVYYALHVRRGDFQFKEVKIGATEIVRNLNSLETVLIPRGALVYLSTDDPDGVCLGCRVKGIPCEQYEKGKKPVGCPEDCSWKAFSDAGWQLRFLKNYLSRGHIKNLNPNFHGMVESIVCSRAKVFAGTYFSTFTGYIHRLRGYHGLGEDTYYHSTGYVKHLRMAKSVGHGWPREWRAGWTDDGGGLI